MMGLSYSDLLKMDIRQFNNYIEGFVDRRELAMNDEQSLIKISAMQIAMAVWGNKKFNKPLKQIKLRGESRAAKLAQALNSLGVTKDGLDAYMKRKGLAKDGNKSK